MPAAGPPPPQHRYTATVGYLSTLRPPAARPSPSHVPRPGPWQIFGPVDVLAGDKAAYNKKYGADLWKEDIEQYDKICKVEPFQRGLKTLETDCMVNGRTRWQARHHHPSRRPGRPPQPSARPSPRPVARA